MTAARVALITGGSGFIGRRLAARLVSLGWDVVCTGRRDPSIMGVRFLPIASFSKHELSQALKGLRINTVFHLAAYGVAPDNRDPTEMFAVNVAGTAAIVNAAAALGAEAVIYAGSCAEYAEANPGQPIKESQLLATHGLYGPSKASGGHWGQALACHLGIGFIHLRVFGVYGPGESSHRMLPSIIGALARGEGARLSPGYQVRDLLHVDDVVEGLLYADLNAAQGVWGTYNLCSGIPIRIRDAALIIADVFGASRELLLFGAIPVRPGETMWQVGDGTAFARLTGFVPTLSLQDGITQTIRALDTRHHAEVET